MREMDVVGVRIEAPMDAPVLLLRESGGERYLPIWIGAAEADAIVGAIQGQDPVRPLTHDLFVESLGQLGHQLDRVQITDVSEGTFFAELIIDGQAVSARPSDAVALAMRVGASIMCDDDVLAEAGVVVDEPLDGEAEEEPISEAEVAEFRRFLDSATAEDFDGDA